MKKLVVPKKVRVVYGGKPSKTFDETIKSMFMYFDLKFVTWGRGSGGRELIFEYEQTKDN